MNLVVPDVEATANFFVKYFDFKLQPASNVKYLSVLKGSGGFVLVLSNLPNTPTHNYPKDFHIGFYQTDHHAVDLLYEKLKGDLTTNPTPRNIRDRYGFYFYAPGEILVEVTCLKNNLDQS